MVTAAELKELERQAKEAEKMLRDAERNEARQQKLLSESHGGYAGKSLIEKIRDDLREIIGDFQGWGITNKGEAELLMSKEYLDGLIDGVSHALGILRQNEGQTERRWAEAEWREIMRTSDKK